MSNKGTRPFRIGRIDYTNAWPVFHHFDPTKLGLNAEVLSEMPASLNRKLLAGEIDMAAISSFAFGVSSHSYYLLPNLSVSARERVNSILLFLKSPLEKAINGRIALTNTSATSVNLLKIILEKFYKGKPEYFVSEPSLDDMLENADAALLIGDHAIRASWEDQGYRVIDLGEVWSLWTGFGMTMALWAVRRDAAEAHPNEVQALYEELVESKRRTAGDMDAVIAKAIRTVGGTTGYWRHYFNQLNHDFGPEQLAGLSLYFQYARELGLIDVDVVLEQWPGIASIEVQNRKPQVNL